MPKKSNFRNHPLACDGCMNYLREIQGISELINTPALVQLDGNFQDAMHWALVQLGGFFPVLRKA